jgi:hypothetical protein
MSRARMSFALPEPDLETIRTIVAGQAPPGWGGGRFARAGHHMATLCGIRASCRGCTSGTAAGSSARRSPTVAFTQTPR